MSESVYKHTPITEAVIGISFADPLPQDNLDDITKKFQNHYPDLLKIPNVNLDLTTAFNSAEVKEFKVDNNYRRSTPDMTQMLLLQKNEFICSQLAPYPGWDVFFKRFMRDWKLWKRHLSYRKISGVGARFINRIDIPFNDESPVVMHHEYLNVYPSVPLSFGPLAEYAVQTAVQLTDIECVLLINSAIVPSPLLNHLSVVLDINVSTGNPPQKDEDIFELLEKIRIHKNRAFEECITDKTREIYKHDR